MYKSDTLLPDYEQIIFNNSYLELCLVQVKYPTIQRFSEESYMVGIKEALAQEYPLMSTEQGMNIVITPQGVSQSVGTSLLRFTSIDSRWSVILSSDFVSLETREYTHFEELKKRFSIVLHHINTHLKPYHQLRIGLRYINEFRYLDTESYEIWRQLLNNELLGLGASNVLGGRVEQSIGEVLIRRDDGQVLVRHGFLQGTTITPISTKPAKVGPFYLLDLDYYDEKPINFDVTTPIEQISSYNDFLYRVFRWAIGEGELYQKMRGQL
jgi:uncharacterized protein (TIGR04255 family)